MSYWLTMLLIAAASPEGVLAYVAEDASGTHRVMALGLDSWTVHPVGPGNRDGAPVWSPSGAWLAFESDVDGGRGIAVAEADGSGLRVLGPSGALCFSPAWSPDSARLAYTRAPAEGDALAQLLCVQELGSDVVEVWGDGQPGLLRPQWMPNPYFLIALREAAEIPGVDLPRLRAEVEEGALWCVLTRQSEGGLRVEPVLATRTQILPLLKFLTRTSRNYVAWLVAPHASGTRLAFESNDGGDREIFVLSDKGLVDVSNHRAADWNPVWAPRQRQLLFESFRGGSRGVYHIYADTARVTTVAADAAFDSWAPAWAPDGRRLAYVSDRTGAPEVYLSTVSGKESTPLADLMGSGDGAVARLAPAFQPMPSETKP